MTDLDAHSWVATTYTSLADLLASADEVWDSPSLCEEWQVRHVVAHVTMPVRLTPEAFGAEMAAARGDFSTMSNTVAARDAALPVGTLVAQLRSPRLHTWEPPGGGADGAVSHAVIHSLDVTVALDRPTVAPTEAVVSVLERIVAAQGGWFGVDLAEVRLEATDLDWSWGAGEVIRTDSGRLVTLVSGRTLPDGQRLAKVGATARS
ncbi:TIGR03083 family protein [Pedococcus dokdonensis]|uniref:TIGR03083 family protein n=1 Tax=Pedococcus dokdonensis TaxID=443156 RepID=A0A1H0ND74_9MICO|nr:maleylpyruvate isomerase family mycothiol-dependent enzyme [Pedococcus dokdonensis]SDO90345.1 TIGR03083 family protein [Pedococcus dokdonensis]